MTNTIVIDIVKPCYRLVVSMDCLVYADIKLYFIRISLVLIQIFCVLETSRVMFRMESWAVTTSISSDSSITYKLNKKLNLQNSDIKFTQFLTKCFPCRCKARCSSVDMVSGQYVARRSAHILIISARSSLDAIFTCKSLPSFVTYRWICCQNFMPVNFLPKKSNEIVNSIKTYK